MAKYFEFEVSLKGVKPKIFRRFALPAGATFSDLHCAIQDSCGWQYDHLHAFQTEEGEDLAVGAEGEASLGSKVPKDRRVKLYSYFGLEGEVGKKCTYTYDFGDSWEHEVKLLRVFEEKVRFQRKIFDGARAFPPEDCGGIWGYQDCVQIVKAKRKLKGTEERLAWLGDWHPEKFNLDEVRARFDH